MTTTALSSDLDTLRDLNRDYIRSVQASERGVTSSPAEFTAYNSRPHVVFVNTSFDEYNDRLAVLPLDDEKGSRVVANLRCERVAVGAGVGLCLNADRGVLTRYFGYLFDEGFHQRSEFPLQGVPSRARVSPA